MLEFYQDPRSSANHNELSLRRNFLADCYFSIPVPSRHRSLQMSCLQHPDWMSLLGFKFAEFVRGG
jgi:hypothetical protein